MVSEYRPFVVIVCDDFRLSDVVGSVLRDLGCASLTAGTESAAREILLGVRPDLLIVDGFLGGVPCEVPETLPLIEFARARNPELPVLVFSAEPTIRKAVEERGYAFLLKPAHLRDLENKINECLFAGIRFGRPPRRTEPAK